MNADEFYRDFKAALDFLGVGWKGKEFSTVTVKDGCFVLSCENLAVAIDLTPKTQDSAK